MQKKQQQSFLVFYSALLFITFLFLLFLDKHVELEVPPPPPTPSTIPQPPTSPYGLWPLAKTIIQYLVSVQPNNHTFTFFQSGQPNLLYRHMYKMFC